MSNVDVTLFAGRPTNRHVTVSGFLTGREILDSRGQPMFEAAITVEGQLATASVTSGKSAERFKALERRDKDTDRYNGYAGLRAVERTDLPA